MNFDVYGGFELQRVGLHSLDMDNRTIKEFWEWVEEEEPGLSGACGCYVFSLRTSKGSLPWYVGKAEKLSFRKECLNYKNRVAYHNVIQSRKGIPELHLLPKVTAKKRSFSEVTKNPKPNIEKLESMLIGMALSRNPNVINVQGARAIQRITVEGVINSRKSKSGPSKELRKIFGI